MLVRAWRDPAGHDDLNRLSKGSVHEVERDREHAWRDLGGEHAGVVVNLARVDQHALRQPRDFLVKARHQRVHGLPTG